MFSLYRVLAAGLVATVFVSTSATRMAAQTSPPAPKLRVCADPNNLPFSNSQQQGFENRIAALIASDMGRQVEYFWFRQGEKFFRRTLNSGLCDVVMGVPTGFDEAATTRDQVKRHVPSTSKCGL